MVKTFSIILFLYLLTLFQTSFFPHFQQFLPAPHFGGGVILVIITVILINLFQNQKENLGFFSAFFGGFFLDIFSENFIGFWVLILLGTAFFIKYIFKKYVRFPIFQKS